MMFAINQVIGALKKHCFGATGTPKCYACFRLFKKTAGGGRGEYLNVKSDGRKLCYDCYENCSPVLCPEQCVSLWDGLVRSGLLHNMQVHGPLVPENKHLRVYLVDEKEMPRIVNPKDKKLRSIKPGSMALYRRPCQITTIAGSRKCGENIEVETQVVPPPNDDGYEEYTILLLFGLPEVRIVQSLSDMLLGVWLKHQGILARLDGKTKDDIHDLFGTMVTNWYFGEINKNNNYIHNPTLAKLKYRCEKQLADRVRRNLTEREEADLVTSFKERGPSIALNHFLKNNVADKNNLADMKDDEADMEDGDPLSVPLLPGRRRGHTRRPKRLLVLFDSFNIVPWHSKRRTFNS